MTSHRTLNIFVLLLFFITAKGFIFQNSGTLSKSQIIDCLEDITSGKLRPECNVHFLKNEFSDDNNEFKKIMIKRVVPRDTSLQTIQIHNGIYKPLKRVPKIRKPNNFKYKISELINSRPKIRQTFDSRTKFRTEKAELNNVKNDIIKLLNSKVKYSKTEPKSEKYYLIKVLFNKNEMKDSNRIYGKRYPKRNPIAAKYILNDRDQSKGNIPTIFLSLLS